MARSVHDRGSSKVRVLWVLVWSTALCKEGDLAQKSVLGLIAHRCHVISLHHKQLIPPAAFSLLCMVVKHILCLDACAVALKNVYTHVYAHICMCICLCAYAYMYVCTSTHTLCTQVRYTMCIYICGKVDRHA